MLNHLTLQVGDVAASQACGHHDGTVAGFFGPEPGSFWLCPPQGDQDRELHIAFRAATRGQVVILHAPRLFPEYHEHYFGAFVRDPDGHNVEAVCHAA